jgi:hypothetical protein
MLEITPGECRFPKQRTCTTVIRWAYKFDHVLMYVCFGRTPFRDHTPELHTSTMKPIAKQVVKKKAEDKSGWILMSMVAG